MTTTTLTQNNQPVMFGDYGLEVVNLFNDADGTGAAITYGQQTGLGIGNATIINAYPNSAPPSGYDWGYSEAFWSAWAANASTALPTVSNIQHLVVNFSTALSGTGIYDQMLDLEVMNSAGKASNEISIFLTSWSKQSIPTGAQLITVGGITAYFQAQTETGGGNFWANGATQDCFYLAANTLTASGTVDYAAILQFLEQKGLVNPADTISGFLSLNTENSTGSNSLTINNFSVFETLANTNTINETASMNGQVFSVTTNNNYVINGGTYTGDSVAINDPASKFTITEKPSGEIDLSAPGYGSIAVTNVSSIQFSDGTATVTNGHLIAPLTQNGQAYAAGDYTIFNNEWGLPGTGVPATQGYVDTIYSAQGGIGGVTFNNVFPDYRCPNAVWTFSEVYWGAFAGLYSDPTNGQVKTTVSNIKSLLVNYATSLTGTTDQNGDELIQLYIRDSTGKIKNDISVQTYGWDPTSGAPSSNAGTTGWTAQAYSDKYITSNLLLGTSSFVGVPDLMEVFRTTTDQLSGTVDVALLLQYLVKLGLVSASDYLAGIELGTEDGVGSSIFTVNGFNVFETVNTTSTITDNGSQANQFFDITTNNNYVINGTTAYATGDIVRINSSAFSFSFTTSSDGHLHLVQSGFGSIDITNIGTIQFSDGNLAIGANNALTLSTSSSSLTSANLSALETINTGSGNHIAVTLTDAAALPTIMLTADQFAALKAINGTFNTEISLPSTSTTVHGGLSGLGTIVAINGASSAYTISAAGDGTDFTITGNGATYHLSGITEVQFSDSNLIISSQTATGTSAPTSAQVTELYGAVFGRLPDVGGLAYYERTAAANPGVGFLTYAEWFLSSPEYTGNSAHAYALNSTGDAQFITDSYQNLLGRAPEAGAVQWYEANVINPIIQADTAAGQTMAQAELQAHAQVLVYFSQSNEFVNDVSTTGTGIPAFGGHHWLILV